MAPFYKGQQLRLQDGRTITLRGIGVSAFDEDLRGKMVRYDHPAPKGETFLQYPLHYVELIEPPRKSYAGFLWYVTADMLQLVECAQKEVVG